jgi:chitin deacetylase
MQTINASMTQWLSGPKSPGLIVLEHELSDESVQAFMDAYPVIKQNGWKMDSVARLFGNSAFFNADSLDSDTVTPMVIVEPETQIESSSDSASATGSDSGSQP